MAQRYTIKDAEYAFFRLMRRINGDHNEKNPHSLYVTGGSVVGRYAIDYAPIYGGVCLVRCVNEFGAITHVTSRMTPREFCRFVDAMDRTYDEQAAEYDTHGPVRSWERTA